VKYIIREKDAFLGMLFASVLLGFFCINMSFPYGGGFGKSISTWLIDIVGEAGVYVLLITLLSAAVIWAINPNFNDFTFRQYTFQAQANFNDFIARIFPARSKKSARNQPVLSNNITPSTDPEGWSFPKPEQKEAETAKTLSTKESNPEPEQLELEIGVPQVQVSGGGFDTPLEIEEPAGAVPSAGLIQEEMEITEDSKVDTELYDPTLDLRNYIPPGLDLLIDYSDGNYEMDRAELERNKDQIIETLANYKIEIVKIKATIGPTVTLYEIIPAPGVRISKIRNLEDDIALSLSALGIRIIAPIPGKGTVGIEVPNSHKQTVSLKEVLASDRFRSAKMELPIALGKTISNEVFVADLAKMPHLLIAGATGQGKSVGINTILMSLLYNKHPSQVKLVLIDPKKVELFPYAAIEDYFLTAPPNQEEPIVTDTKKVVATLNSLLIEMEERYNLLKKAKVRHITDYNQKFTERKLNPNKGHKFLPYIVLVIDEFADLIMTAGKEVENPIARLAQLSRAVGIHLIIATQRPSVNIITGVIKANFPARIAFKVTAMVDSKTILDTPGAERLVGRGDMLLSYGADVVRLQCAFIDTPEVEKVIEHIEKQPSHPRPYYLPEFHSEDDEINGGAGLKYSDLDALFSDAAKLVVTQGIGSTSMLQRRMKLGYNRAGRIMDQLEALNIVGPSAGSKAREVYVHDIVELERLLDDLKRRK
jgi:S-DNA-T family DNA segregation ATPase FtsK/SpoIIIE